MVFICDFVIINYDYLPSDYGMLLVFNIFFQSL